MGGWIAVLATLICLFVVMLITSAYDRDTDDDDDEKDPTER